MKNTIPRKFNKMVGKMLIETNVNIVGDIIHLTKDDRGYHIYNTRTQEYAQGNLDLIRNKSLFELQEVN